ncbi:uncharacterized protein SCODWIG_01526 [Saccharomycodes ludwigii]|uniref:Uncharacterized protein n=1 Tax=Saccharomycodes ludwigii TaxID=36035 RepID=A0A376B4Z8_9ASCO|nr:hypothetical protein SCDLUD_004124 [Saccharomycodes ludwigii]KAH3899831.1 hypothetical protein SCDLUD_004124 [Saccharomycodes ludwigii]SSD59765.1 uncharacterized protein SCODWIG_01526 [Saccharomycodes ludwigii]
MDNWNDCFEYLVNLTQQLIDHQKNNRLETNKLEQVLRRISKQSYITYEEYSKNDLTNRITNTNGTDNENTINIQENQLINENYKLIYQIKQQLFLKDRMCKLIEQFKELIRSIKFFILEQNNLMVKLEKDIINSYIYNNVSVLNNNLTEIKFLNSNLKFNVDQVKLKLDHIIKNLLSQSNDGATDKNIITSLNKEQISKINKLINVDFEKNS